MVWERAVLLAELPVAETRPVTVADEAILLCRTGESEIYAVADRCSHDDAALAGGELVGREIVCPRHGARFDVTTGAVLKMPAPVGIETFPVRLTDDGWIEVEVPA
jgi:3-phenylpropionate/trans-cinnamate dioxygenase ferredoxin subunit